MIRAKDLVKNNFVKVDLNDTVAQFLGKIRQKKQTFAVVFDGKKYKGIVGRTFLHSSTVNIEQMKIKNAVKHASRRKTPFYVPKLKKTSEIEEMCKLFASSGVRALPVFDKTKFIGIVTARSLLRKIKSAYKGLPILELAQTKLITAKQKDTTATAIKTMNRSHVDRLPVITAAGKIVGIVTAFDIMKRFHRWPRQNQRMPSSASRSDWKDPSWGTGEKQSMLKQPVKNIMTPYPMVCCADAKSTVNQAIDMMIKEDVNSVVVIEKEKPIGIITIQDIMSDYSLD